MKIKRYIAVLLSLAVVAATLTVGMLANADGTDKVPDVTYDFEDGQRLPYSYMQYSTEQVSGGANSFMTCTVESGGEYSLISFRTNYILYKNRKYTVKFKYRMDMKRTDGLISTADTYFAHPIRPVLGDEKTSYNFYDCGKGLSMETANLYKPNKNVGLTLKNTSSWTEATVSFDTTETAELFSDNARMLGFVLQMAPNRKLTLSIDDIEVYDETGTPLQEGNTRLMSDATLGKNTLYVAKGGTNIITDYSFESGNGNWTAITAGGALSVTSQKAHSGANSLMFSANGTQSVSSFDFNVDPYTEYYLSVWVLGDNYSKTNKNNMYFGISDPESGYFIISDGDTRESSKTQQLTCAAWDGEWHLVNVKFNSGPAYKLSFAVRGKQSTAYFDELSIFKSENREKYKAAHEKIQDAVLSSKAVNKLTACADGKSLIENGDLSDDTSGYWQAGTNFGIYKDNKIHYTANFLEIADTGSTKGKALHYKANLSVTGVPLQTYYMKWIDVEPNTDYTFSADLLILQQGGGEIRIVDSNSFFPSVISSINFGEANFNKEIRWQKYAFSFNSGGYDKIGFFVMDGGGEAYIDNIRLFKTADAVEEAEETYPSEITSDYYTVSDGTITIDEYTTIGEALSRLDGSEFIKVYRDGVEITDRKQYIRTGMKLRYMDGVTEYASATVKVDCDNAGLCIMGPNLLTNGGLENGRIAWGGDYCTMDAIAPTRIVTDVVHSGDHSVKFGNGYVSTYFEGEDNTDYMLTYWIRSGGTCYLRLSNGITTNKVWDRVAAIDSTSNSFIGSTGEKWVKKTVSFNSGKLTDKNIGIVFSTAGGEDYDVYIDDVEVKKANAIAHIFENGECKKCHVTEYDYNADGLFDLRDLVRIKKHLVGVTSEIAAFHDSDGVAGNSDMVSVKKRLLGLE